MMEIKLKKAKRKNFRKISKIYMESFSEPPYNEKWTSKIVLDKIKLFSRYCDIWEIWYEKQLAGFFVINPSWWCSGEIIFGEELAIDKKFRKKGIGTYVLKEIFKIYKKKGFKKYMGIVNNASNAIGLHKKVGAYKNKYDLLMEAELK